MPPNMLSSQQIKNKLPSTAAAFCPQRSSIPARATEFANERAFRYQLSSIGNKRWTRFPTKINKLPKSAGQEETPGLHAQAASRAGQARKQISPRRLYARIKVVIWWSVCRLTRNTFGLPPLLLCNNVRESCTQEHPTLFRYMYLRKLKTTSPLSTDSKLR